MGCMHAPGKGLSQLVLPYCHSVPTWLKLTSDDVKEQIYRLAKKGLTPSQIGVILRDSHGAAQVRFVTGNNILRLLKSKGLAPDLPEDLYHLIKKAVAVQKHPESSRKNKDAKFRLILIESWIHHLARYCKTKRILPPSGKYQSSTASALVTYICLGTQAIK
ncbi:40S ribosomal protein S13-like [Papio anubis]|uniref:Small ribosomal subunit protein uS15 n=1 Tax=Papio anubis TaxID=9555 RepID=A0A8I5NSY1_PAPAN|nr:40S ribosomal protein S13-like [Papio anubis]